MRVMVLGQGGREHALAWRLAASPRVDEVLVVPGNAGTAAEPGVRNLSPDGTDHAALVRCARAQGVDLVVVGPEMPLIAGVADVLREHGLPCLGPGGEAAMIEGSKSYARAFCRRHRIPAPESRDFTTLPEALAYLRECTLPVVVKADGAAAGKGVVITAERAEAAAVVEAMLHGQRHGEAGRRVLIEEYLRGEEVSFIALTDGRHLLPLATAQDHKARDDGGQGPNTGGMGACSPAPIVDAALHARLMREVMQPAVAGLAAEGRPYVGFLYAGLMILPDGEPRVLEFNCRAGDPETQPMLMRLDGDLAELCLATVEGRLDQLEIAWDPRAAVGVVLAAAGYPGTVQKGDVITGLDHAFPAHVKVFHAGTRRHHGEVVSDGGRVLCVTALGEDVAAARRHAYAAVSHVHWPGSFHRSDIALHAAQHPHARAREHHPAG